MLNPNSPYQPLNPQKRQFRWSRRSCLTLLGGLLVLLLAAILIYQIPWFHDRLAWRLENLRTRVVYFFNPPDEAIFVPEESALAQAATRTPSTTPNAPTPTPAALSTALPTATPLPGQVILDGVVYVDQHGGWNLCGPANLTMALKFWGWEGTRTQVASYVKPGPNDPGLDALARQLPDKNVMPYELEDFVDSQVPGMQAAVRIGGDISVLKNLIASGFPVLVEKGYYELDASGRLGWLGHYLFVTGYDDASGYFVVQDAYLKTGENGTGANLHVSYEDFIDQWRSFNYLFLVVYPEEHLNDVITALGPWNDETWANQHALDTAEAEASTLTGIDQYFAWFNVGSSHVALFEYVDAGSAYDYAFDLYANLEDDDTQRPYRMLWYQTGPYWAYYYSGRYRDVINLANKTFDTIADPTLEESLYWRGMGYEALGELDNAIADYREAVRLNPNFTPGYDALARLGVQP